MIAGISPLDAAGRMKLGATLVDIREADEFAREHAKGARHQPLSGLAGERLSGPVIFTCRTGNRTQCNEAALAAAVDGEVLLLDGGLEAWRGAGLPVVADRAQPIEIIRQVQIGAGALVLTGVLLGAFAHPGFYLLSAGVGFGLLMAGISGSCLMATLLRAAPWNRQSRPA